MATKKPAPIDIIDAALGYHGGESQIIVLNDCELSIKRNYTGAEAQAFLALWNPEADASETWLDDQLDLLSDSTKEEKAAFVAELRKEAMATIYRVLQKIAMIAGLRDGNGRFLPGPLD